MQGTTEENGPMIPARWLPCFLFPLSCLLLGAASPPAEMTPDDLVRQANAAFEAKNEAEADRLYALAEERTTDPGLVAFNRATVLGRAGHAEKFRDAEKIYARVLKDEACPPERAARANYNRGTCLLHIGGPSAVYLDAIKYLSRCYDSDAADAPLKASARNNLKLAKTLWKKAYDEEKKAGKKPERPNDNPPPDEQRDDAPRHGDTDPQPGTNDPGAGGMGQPITKPMVQPSGAANANTGQTANQTPAPGTNPDVSKSQNFPDAQPRTPEATRKFLQDAAVRMQRERHAVNDSLYASQLGVRDR
jgi:hypothetical protein